MFFAHSIRWRLQLWHGIILLAVLGGFGITAWKLQQQRTLRTAEERITERYNNVLRLIRQSGPSDGAHPRPAPPPAPQAGPGPEDQAGTFPPRRNGPPPIDDPERPGR
jgi:hypothetical protein